MATVMVGDEVTATVTMAGAVAGRWGGEVITVRQVTGRRAGVKHGAAFGFHLRLTPSSPSLGWQERRREA